MDITMIQIVDFVFYLKSKHTAWLEIDYIKDITTSILNSSSCCLFDVYEYYENKMLLHIFEIWHDLTLGFSN